MMYADHVGETREMQGGFKCTILCWRSETDIDVMLQTEKSVTARLHQRYSAFLQGTIE